MKKRYLLLAVLALTLCGCGNKDTEEVEEKEEVKTEVVATLVSEAETYYDTENGTGEVIQETTTVYEYDKKGNLTGAVRTFYSQNYKGEFVDYIVYEYDKYGNLLSESFYSENSDSPSSVNSYVYEYEEVEVEE